jgi:hypothetical protein
VIRHAPVLEHFADIHVDVAAVHALPTAIGTRLTYVIAGGHIEATTFTAEILPGGGDWVLVGTDQVARLDVRAIARTVDGALLHLTNIGRVRMDPAAAERLAAGELIRHDQMYGRSSPLFDTDDPRYRWLTGMYTVAVNEVSLHEVNYQVFAVH